MVAASIGNEAAVLATHDRDQYQLHLVRFDELAVAISHSVVVEATISAVTMDVINGVRMILMATWRDNCPHLAFYRASDNGSVFPNAVHDINLGTFFSPDFPRYSCERLTRFVPSEPSHGPRANPTAY